MILSHSVLQDHFYRAFVMTLFIIKTKSSVVLIFAYEWLDVAMSWVSSCKEDLSLVSFFPRLQLQNWWSSDLFRILSPGYMMMEETTKKNIRKA